MIYLLNRRYRKRRRSLKGLVLKRVRSNAQWHERYKAKFWTRFWHKLGLAFTATFFVIGIGMACLGVAFMGTFFVGVRAMGMWIGAGVVPDPVATPVAASLALCSIGLTLIGVQRLRKMPLSPYSQSFVHLPVRDRSLIGSAETSLLIFALPLALVSLGSLPFLIWTSTYPIWEIVRCTFAISATAVTGWLMTETLAKYIPISRMLSTVIILALLGILTLLISLAVVPRSYTEITQESLYGPLLYVPPSGFYLGLTNLVAPTFFRGTVMPLLGLLTAAACFYVYVGTLELRDIRLVSNARATASRSNWISSWSAPVARGRLAQVESRAKALDVISEYREQALRESASSNSLFKRLLRPLLFDSKQLSCLGLLGIRNPRGKSFAEIVPGFAAVPVAIGLVAFNQFYPLAGIPGFLRFPLILSFAIALVDFREVSSSMVRGEQALGFTLARSLFPFSYPDILSVLLKNRILLQLEAFPGWAVALALLATTDIPKVFLFNIPAILIALNLLIPLLSAATFSTGNLRSCWKAWLLCVIPWSILVGLFFIGLQVGVFGYFMSMRVDLAWFWLLIGGSVLILASLVLAYALKRGAFDENTTPLNNFFKLR